MNNIIFRKAEIKDLPKIIELRLNLWKQTGKINSNLEFNKMYEINYEYFENNMLNGDLIIYLYESEKPEIISIGIGVIVKKPPINLENIGSEGYIFNMYTKEEYRKNGYATKILEEIKRYFNRKNVKIISLISNENSFKLYEQNGFKNNKFYQEYER